MLLKDCEDKNMKRIGGGPVPSWHQEYDGQGNIIQKLACRESDPERDLNLSNGRTVKMHPVILFCADNPHRDPCLLSEESIPDSAVVNSVPKADCEVQKELGICPLLRQERL